MALYAIYTDKGIRIADVTNMIGDKMILEHDGHWDKCPSWDTDSCYSRRWVFDVCLAYTAPLHQVRIYINDGYYMKLLDN